ncbi:MAG TPA: hypothetical protein VEX43_13200 [Chthoniobacterales bacterium]|nr:hypothetical protein [Chthoniobacterales bacterium]
MAVVGAILLLIGAGWFVQTQGILHRYQRNLLEEPVLFGEKFEVRRDFKVDLATTYLIGLKLEKALPFSLENPTPPDGFLAEFRINSGDRIVVEGHNNSDPRRPAIMTAESTTRLLGTFFAQPERVYTLTFRMKDFAQDLAGIKGQILIRTDFVDNKSAFVNAMVNRFLAVAVAVLGLLFALLSFTGFGAAKN